jgi:hypothetical protein
MFDLDVDAGDVAVVVRTFDLQGAEFSTPKI